MNVSYNRTTAVLGGRYLRFFAASIVATLLLQVSVVTDTIFVGQLLGPVPMSGIRVASPIVNLLGVMSTLVGVGGSTVTAIAMGQHKRDEANRAFTMSIALGCAIGVVFGLLVFPLADDIAQLISSDSATVGYTSTFLRVVALGSPAYILASVMAMLLRADSSVRLSSAVLAAGGLANVGFDLLFMGVFGMGVEGSALATDMAMLSAVLLSLPYFRWPQRTLRLCTVARRDALEIVSSIFRNGSSASLRMLFACVSLLFLNYVVGETVGVTGIALLTVCGNIQLLTVAFFGAGGQAAMPIEGVLYGERDFAGIRLLLRYVFRVILGCVSVIVVLIWLFPAQIVSLFVPGGIEGSEWLLRLYSLGFVPMSINYLLLYHYNTIQRRTMALVLTLCENLVLYLPFIWILTRSFGLVGAISSFVCAETLTTVATLLVASVFRHREGLPNLLLVPDVPLEVVYEASAPATSIDASGIAHDIKATLDTCGVQPTLSVRTAMGVEEMIANAASAEANVRQKATFDVRVSTLPDCVQVALRDNGVPFDPTIPESEEARPDKGLAADASDNISALKAIASHIEYRHTLGLNQTTIEIREDTEHA